jgi:hypothetical protein
VNLNEHEQCQLRQAVPLPGKPPAERPPLGVTAPRFLSGPAPKPFGRAPKPAVGWRRFWEPERLGRREAAGQAASRERAPEQPSAREEDGKKLAEKGAELADELLGRKEQPASLPDSISGIKIKGRKGSDVARANAHVSAAAAWIACSRLDVELNRGCIAMVTQRALPALSVPPGAAPTAGLRPDTALLDGCRGRSGPG